MPRNMSFSLTTDQVRSRKKTVTRRKGWTFLKRGDVLNACVKCQGLKPGEQIERLCQIRVVDVRRERLDCLMVHNYAMAECELEGFPEMLGPDFVKMFCSHMGGKPSQEVTRIAFEYLE